MKSTFLSLILLPVAFQSRAQDSMRHQEHHMQQYQSNMHRMMPGMMKDMMMSHSLSPNLPMNRNGSGSSWLPDNSPIYGKMFHQHKWLFMLHGNLFVRYTKQDLFQHGSRGGDKLDAPNWLMLMGQRKVGGKGLLAFNAMLSLDALVAGGSGYPLLFQSGETWHGKPLVDRQHPHDLFSGLSLSYVYALNRKTDIYVSAGYPGEPALGSGAFMHRPSALPNPDAPISHHWNDGTHITFGVATAGIRYGRFKLEYSSFTGREPDENRWNFDRPLFDSWSSRVSCNPDVHWALQVSHGYIKSPEAAHPEENIQRTTASAIYSTRFTGKRYLNATALWGMNKISGHDGEHALLLEASLASNRWNTYGRYEWVQKSAEELNLSPALFDAHNLFPVHVITLGTQYEWLQYRSWRSALGAQASVYAADDRLNGLYGKNPVSGSVYLRLYPGVMP